MSLYRPTVLSVLSVLVLAGPACAQNTQQSGDESVVISTDDGNCTIRVAAPPGNDIHVLISRVAEDEGVRIITDPRVNARVQESGVSLEDVDMESLQAILRVHAYVMAEVGGELVIVPDNFARVLPVPAVQTDDPDVSDHTVVSRVINVGEGAQMLVPILRPLIPQYGHLAATEEGLIVVARYDKVREITAIVEELTQ